MPILHVRLYGNTTQINIPQELNGSRLRLKSYRILWNRDNHGFYHGTLTCTMLSRSNVLAYTTQNNALNYEPEVPLFIHPENKLTQETVDWDLGSISNTLATLQFQIQYFNCIQRSRYDMAYFDTQDSQQYLNFTATIPNASGTTQLANFNGHVPMYICPKIPADLSTPPANATTYSVPGFKASDYFTNNQYDQNGNVTATTNPLTPTFPSARVYVHTGVHVGWCQSETNPGVDPQPGGVDYTTDVMNAQESLMVKNSNGFILGSGIRRGAIIYPFSVDLVFEFY